MKNARYDVAAVVRVVAAQHDVHQIETKVLRCDVGFVAHMLLYLLLDHLLLLLYPAVRRPAHCASLCLPTRLLAVRWLCGLDQSIDGFGAKYMG
jgi:hypothetical protein